MNYLLISNVCFFLSYNCGTTYTTKEINGRGSNLTRDMAKRGKSRLSQLFDIVPLLTILSEATITIHYQILYLWKYKTEQLENPL